jgi:hypothetical protein
VQSRGVLPLLTRFYVALPIPLPAQPAQSLLAAASGARILTARENFRTSELAPVTLSSLSLLRIAHHVQHPVQKQGRPVPNQRNREAYWLNELERTTSFCPADLMLYVIPV